MFVSLDFETRNVASIKSGVYKYAETAEILCLSYSIDGGLVRTWQPGDRVPPYELLEAIYGGAGLQAYNAAFERVIWDKVMVPRHGWPKVEPERWFCTMAQALCCGLPASLEHAADTLSLAVKKDVAGGRLMKQMSKPRKPTKKNPSLWHDTPEKRAKLIAYCEQDVRTEQAVGGRVDAISQRERAVYLFDQRVNDRGVKIDRELVESAITVWHQYSEKLNEELSNITFGGINSAGEVAKILDFVQKRGIKVGLLDSKSVEKVLAGEIESPTARRVLEIRKELAKSSVKKYQRMALCAGTDDRIRGCFQYHGAAQTGRWAGRLVQLQNLPRGGLKPEQVDEIAEAIKSQSVDRVAEYGKVGDVLSSMIRSAIVAGEGKKFLVCDFAAIEARCLAWMANEKWLLEAFRDKKDIYKEMASTIYGVDVEKVNKDQRFYGKTAVLGCIAEGTPVMTDSGWKPIETITEEDLIWDGIELVTHKGLLKKGMKPTLNVCGNWLTPDHLVLCGKEWKESITVLKDPRLLCLALEQGKEAIKSLVSLENVATQDGSNKLLLNAIVQMKNLLLTPDTLTKRKWRVAVDVGLVTYTKRSKTLVLENGYFVNYGGLYEDATTKSIASTPTTEVGVSKCMKYGGKTSLPSYDTLRVCRGGINQGLKWTGSTTTEGTNRGTCDSSLDLKTATTEGKYPTCKRNLMTYDIAFAGPRNRFLIMNGSSPLLVHNCGYQLGASGFQRALESFGVKQDLEFCTKVVDAYRAKNKRIKAFWYEIEDAAVKTVKTGKPHNAGKVTFGIKGDWLCMKLPTGRYIRYYQPKLVPGTFKEQIEFIGPDQQTGKPVRKSTYGGKLTENASQAICRDLLVESMSKLERRGYTVIAHVHDEVICEVAEDFGTIEEMESIMQEVPEWASGFPINTEGFECKRYRK